jgi:glyoxylase-like metal-dependent hydrolase (beta-lactamase superfamily II)
MTAGPFTIDTFTSDAFGQNAYLLNCTTSRDCLAIDPGGDAERMADTIAERERDLRGIVLTHAHLDHLEGVADLVERIPAPIHLHPADRPLYDGAAEQARMFAYEVRPPPPASEELEPGRAVEFGDCTLEVRHAPGHSPGHVILYAPEAEVCFVGDVVFAGSIGRSDLPGGDYQQLMRSIREQVLTLPDETRLYTGHGPVTTVARERATNPFLAPDHPGRWA